MQSKLRIIFQLIPLQLSLIVLSSVFSFNSAILTSFRPTENPRKEKRGIFGFGVHAHHGSNHHHHHDYPPHDDWAPLSPGPIDAHPHHIAPPIPHPPVNLGAHFHTTVTKKIGVPIPYPYPVKVSLI